MSQKNIMFNRLANDINEYLSNLRNQYERDYSLDIQEFIIKNSYNDSGEICSLIVKTSDYAATVNAAIDIKYKSNKSANTASELPVTPMIDLFEDIESDKTSHKEEVLKGVYESDNVINKKQGFSKRIIKNMQSILNDLKNKTKTYDEICTSYNVSKKSLNKILNAYSIPLLESEDTNAQEESGDSDDDEESHLSSEDLIEELIEDPIYDDEINQSLIPAVFSISIENRARILEMIVNNIDTDDICRIMNISQDIINSITLLHKTFITRNRTEDVMTDSVVVKTLMTTQNSSLDERVMACSKESIQDNTTDESLLSFQKYLNTSKPYIRR